MWDHTKIECSEIMITKFNENSPSSQCKLSGSI